MYLDFLDGDGLAGRRILDFDQDISRTRRKRRRDRPFRRMFLPSVEPMDDALLDLALLAEIYLHPRSSVARKRFPPRERRTVENEMRSPPVERSRRRGPRTGLKPRLPVEHFPPPLAERAVGKRRAHLDSTLRIRGDAHRHARTARTFRRRSRLPRTRPCA